MTKSNTPSKETKEITELEQMAVDLFNADNELDELRAQLGSVDTVAVREAVGTNSAKLPWPQDKGGVTSLLRREGARAIGRIGGRPERLALVLEVLDILKAYAVEKYEFQTAAATAKRKAAEDRAEFIRTQRRREAATAIKAKITLAEQSNKEAKALQKEFDTLYKSEA